MSKITGGKATLTIGGQKVGELVGDVMPSLLTVDEIRAAKGLEPLNDFGADDIIRKNWDATLKQRHQSAWHTRENTLRRVQRDWLTCSKEIQERAGWVDETFLVRDPLGRCRMVRSHAQALWQRAWYASVDDYRDSVSHLVDESIGWRGSTYRLTEGTT